MASAAADSSSFSPTPSRRRGWTASPSSSGAPFDTIVKKGKAPNSLTSPAQQEIAPLLDLRGGAVALPKASDHPLAFAVVFSSLKAGLADLFTQLVLLKQDWDIRRTASFSLFGCLYQGFFQFFMINHVWDKLGKGSKYAVLYKILAMNLISDPCLFFPIFYVLTTSIKTNQLAVRQAFSLYRQNYKQDWFNSWRVWVPGKFFLSFSSFCYFYLCLFYSHYTKDHILLTHLVFCSK